MPRANRYHVSHYVWRITHRRHRQQFLLKFARDRQRWIRWLYAARQRYGLCVLDYAVTSNHIHLLVRDQGRGEIACSLQLMAGRTTQAYNTRKDRHGAFWEGRYHATAVETGAHLARCLVYIDLNMVRAGVVVHPAQWPAGGYQLGVRAQHRRVETCGDVSILRDAEVAHDIGVSHHSRRPNPRIHEKDDVGALPLRLLGDPTQELFKQTG